MDFNPNFFSVSPDLIDLVVDPPYQRIQRRSVIGGLDIDLGYQADDEGIPSIARPRRSFQFHRRNLLDVAERETDHGFKELFRLPRPVFKTLKEEVLHHIPPGLKKNFRAC